MPSMLIHLLAELSPSQLIQECETLFLELERIKRQQQQQAAAQSRLNWDTSVESTSIESEHHEHAQIGSKRHTRQAVAYPPCQCACDCVSSRNCYCRCQRTASSTSTSTSVSSSTTQQQVECHCECRCHVPKGWPMNVVKYVHSISWMDAMTQFIYNSLHQRDQTHSEQIEHDNQNSFHSLYSSSSSSSSSSTMPPLALTPFEDVHAAVFTPPFDPLARSLCIARSSSVVSGAGVAVAGTDSGVGDELGLFATKPIPKGYLFDLTGEIRIMDRREEMKKYNKKWLAFPSIKQQPFSTRFCFELGQF